VFAGAVSGSTLPLAITGVAPNASATVSVAVTRTGYTTGTGSVTGQALMGAAYTPSFSAPVRTPDGFTVNVTNYNPAYSFTPSVSAGKVTAGTVSGSTLPLTITGLSPNASATVTVSVTRTGYTTGSATVVGQAIPPALTPTFSVPVRTAVGFTVNVTNYNPAFTFVAGISIGAGTVSTGVASGATLPLTVTGVAPGAIAVLGVTTTRTGYPEGSAPISGQALQVAYVPVLSDPVPTATGFTVRVTNYNPAYVFTPSMASGGGTVTAGLVSAGQLPLTITGLSPNASATVQVVASRAGYVNGTATKLGTALLGAAYVPTFSVPVRTADGFTVNVTNYNAAYSFAPSVTSGAGSVSKGVASGTTLPLTVTGVSPNMSATVSVGVSRVNYLDGTGTVSGQALQAAYVPTFSDPVATATGFTLKVTNYNPAYVFTPSMVSGGGTVTAVLVSAGQLPLTVTGLSPNASATVQVVASRAGYANGTATKLGTALMGAAYTPTFSVPVRTADGFTVNVTNYNPAYVFVPTVSAGAVTRGTAVGTTLPLTVTGVPANTSATVTVSVTRTGYLSGSATSVGQALMGAALTPLLSAPVRTADGFTVNVTNYNPAFLFTPSLVSGGGTVTAGVAAGSSLPLTISGVVPGGAVSLRVASSRVNYADGVGNMSSTALPGAALTPTFSTPVRTADGFTVNVTNYNPAYAFTPSVSAGKLTAGTVSGSTLPLTVTGVAPNASVTLTLSVTRTGYTTGSATSVGQALAAAWTPTFSVPVRTADGFTVNVTNYNRAFSFAPTVVSGVGTLTPGTVSGSTLPLTVTGVVPGGTVMLGVSTSRSGYATGSATMSGQALQAAYVPTFSDPVATATGFTLKVTNYNPAYVFTPSMASGGGTVTVGLVSAGQLPLTVTGLLPNASATVQVVASRAGSASGTATKQGTALMGAAYTPTFSVPVRTADGFTVNVTNYNPAYVFAPTVSAGAGAVTKGVASGTTLPLTVTGVSPNTSATVTVGVSRVNYLDGAGSTTGQALQAAYVPTFSDPVATATGFTVRVTNYDPAYVFTPSMASGGGTVTVGLVSAGQLPLTITGLAPGAQATVQVATSRAGYANGTGTKLGTALPGAAYTPTFSAPVRTADGFTVNVTNYNPAYSFGATVSVGVGSVSKGAASGATLPLTVTGVSPNASATVTVSVTRTGYNTGSATSTGLSLQAAYVPIFSDPVATATGFTVTVTNYDPAYTFTPTVSTGTLTRGIASGSNLPLTVTGLAPGAQATVQVVTSRALFANGTASKAGTALPGAAYTPTFSVPVRTADGFTVNVTNYNPAYTFAPTVTSGAGSVSKGTASGATLPLTITGVPANTSATVTVSVTRTGYLTGSATSTGQALMGAAYTPTFSTPVPTADGFKVTITNYNPAYSFTPTVVAGDGTVTAGVASGSVLPLTVTGMTAGASRVSVATSRTNYTPGVAEVRSPALPVIQALSVSGSVSKGTSITITGTNLVGASVVSIGGVAAPKFTVTSPTTIVVGVWNGAVSGPVRVTTGGGVAVSAGSLTVTAALTAPTLAAVSPLSVTSGGKGQTVVVTGTNLGSVTQVMRGTVAVPFQVLSATKLLLTIPAGAATGAFTITTAGGSVSTASFTVTATPVAPVFTGPAVTAKAGTVLTLSGANIGAVSAITWAGASFATYWVTDAGTVQVYVPAVAAPGTGSLVLTTPGGTATLSLTVTG
jgi:hypothetical protein